MKKQPPPLPPAPVGRPSKKPTPELIERAVAACLAGNFEKVAARSIGVSHTTWCKWKVLGKNGQQPYAEFLERITRALTEAEQHAVQCVKTAMPEDWRAAAWYLERRFRSKWGKIHIEHTGKNGEALPAHETHIHLNLGKLADEELSLVERLAKRGAIVKPPVGSNGNGHAPEDAGAAD